MDAIRELLRAASSKRGNARSAAGGKQGHQKTPALLEAVATDAQRVVFGEATMKDVKESGTSPRGGFTDVG